MIAIVFFIAIIIIYVLVILMAFQESKKRKINLYAALALVIFVSPILAYLIIQFRPYRTREELNRTKEGSEEIIDLEV